MLAICEFWDQGLLPELLVSYTPLAALTSGVLRAFSGPREASAEASRAAAGSPRHEIGGEDTTRARPFVNALRARFPNCSASGLEETGRRGAVPLPLPPDPSGLGQYEY